MRVASLLPSATEIVCALPGGREMLVGVSHECDHPPGLDDLPRLTRPRRELPSGSAAIDRDVRAIVADALAVYEIELERLRAAAPDVVVTQDLCDVCAVSLDDVTHALRALARDDARIVSTQPTRLADVWNDVRRVGAALDRAAEADEIASELERRCARIAARTRAAPSRPSVLTIEWLDPVMVGGTWMPELVELAGGVPLVTRPGDHAPTLGRDDLAALDPDVVLIKPCGFDLERTAAEHDRIVEMLPWHDWSAARHGRVFAADGNAFFNRPGPRLVESLELLTECVQPGAHDLDPDLRRALRRVTRDGIVPV